MQKTRTNPTPEELSKYDAEGTVTPSKLVKGTKLFIETNARIFEFQTLGNDKAMVRSTGTDFKKDTLCRIVGSLDKDGMVFADRVVREKHLIISLPKGRHVTGLIRAASLQGAGWSYEMWK